MQGRARCAQEREEEGWISGILLISTPSCPGPPVPAHSDAGEVHGRHCQWHGVSEYQEVHTPGPGCQELHVSVKPSREHPPFLQGVPSLLGRMEEGPGHTHTNTHTHSRLRQVRTQDWEREVSKRYGEGFLEEMGPELRS